MKLENLGKTFISGAIINYAPQMLKGAMSEYLCKVKFDDVLMAVNENYDLWEKLPDNYKKMVCGYGPRLGPLEWFTIDWVIDSARDTAPSLASLFIGWPEGREWMQHQIDDIKEHIKTGNVAGKTSGKSPAP